MKTSTFTLLSRFTVALLVLAVTWADTDTAEAQRGGSRGSRSSRGRDGLMDLAQDREVRAELKLTDEQIESVGEIRDKSRSGLSEKFREFGERIAAAKDDAERTKIEAERTDYFAARRKAAEVDLAKVVSAEQFRGLQLHQLNFLFLPSLTTPLPVT